MLSRSRLDGGSVKRNERCGVDSYVSSDPERLFLHVQTLKPEVKRNSALLWPFPLDRSLDVPSSSLWACSSDGNRWDVGVKIAGARAPVLFDMDGRRLTKVN